jgi:AcrR family transcriptional regulator
MPEHRPTLLARRRAETQRVIQDHAVRLFAERGYDATTVADVAEAAGVSAMTVYRHFPTKEDLVLLDQRNELVAGLVAASPATDPVVRRVSRALVASAEAMATTDDTPSLLARLRLMTATPALRAKHLDSHYALQRAIVDALEPAPEEAFRTQAAVSACLGAMHTALVRWAETDGETALPDLVAAALTAALGPHALSG